MLSTPVIRSTPRPTPHGLLVFQGFFPGVSEAVGLLLLALPLLVAFATIDSARWVEGMPPLAIEVVVAGLLARSLVSRLGAPRHILGLGIGLAVSFVQGIFFLTGSPTMPMGIVLLVMTWWTGYFTIWMAYRGLAPVLMIIPSLLVLLVAVGFLSTGYHRVLPLFFLASAPALAHFHFLWWNARASTPGPRPAVVAGGVAVMTILVAAAWLLPTPEGTLRPGVLKRLEDPLLNAVERYSDFFASVPNRKDWPRIDLEARLPFTGPIAPTDDVLMVVKAPAAHKWRLRVYETYDPLGWSAPDKEAGDIIQYTALAEREMPVAQITLPTDQVEVPIEVRLVSSMGFMATAGEPITAAGSSKGSMQLSPTPRFTLDVTGQQTSYVPLKVAELRSHVVEALFAGEEEALADEMGIRGLRMEASQSSDAGWEVALERIEHVQPPSIAMRFNERRAPPRTYQTLGVLSTAPPRLLRVSSPDIPTSITDRYLQLPPNFPEEVKQLARDQAAGLNNPYDISMSIQEYLRAVPYTTTSAMPTPSGLDPVHWFITEEQVGFSHYYASAMVTMLRSIGIPARLVTGFAPGERDEERDVWVVRARHYHAWPEVYFHGYGWVEFEPTPANIQPSLQYLGFTYQVYDTDLDLGEGGEFDDCDLSGWEEGLPCDAEDLAALLAALDAQDTAQAPSDVGSGTDNTRTVLIALGWVVGLSGLALGAIWGINALNRRRLRRSYAARVFSSMQTLAGLGGASRRVSETANEFGGRLARLLPTRTEAIARITATYAYTQYSRTKTLESDQTKPLSSAWKSVRSGLFGLMARRLQLRRPLSGDEAAPATG